MMQGTAFIDETEAYRYSLSRSRDPDKPMFMFKC